MQNALINALIKWIQIRLWCTGNPNFTNLKSLFIEIFITIQSFWDPGPIIIPLYMGYILTIDSWRDDVIYATPAISL